MQYLIEALSEILQYRNTFNILESIAYKDISINGICIKPLGIHFMDNGPAWSVNSHRHSFFELHYIISGNAYTTLDGMEYEIESGWFYLMPPGILHSHRQLPGTTHLGFALRWEITIQNDISTPILYQDSKEFVESFFTIKPLPLKDEGTVLNKMLCILETVERGSHLLELQVLFFQLLLSVANSCPCSVSNAELKINRNFIDSNVISNSVRFIEENYSQGINVHDVSNSVHLSYSHLSRLFKTYTGETITHYINKTRIQKAQYLLKCSSRDIDSIAHEVGFESGIYFCSAFKKALGLSPGQYRKSNKRLTE